MHKILCKMDGYIYCASNFIPHPFAFQTVTVMHDEGDMGTVSAQVWRNPDVARPSPAGTVIYEETFSKTPRVTPVGRTVREVVGLACERQGQGRCRIKKK